MQRGRDLGSFLGGLFRFVKPLFVKGTKVVGKGGHRLEPEEIHRTVLHHRLVQEQPTGRNVVQTSLQQLSNVYDQGCPDVISPDADSDVEGDVQL
uniref:Uncharacterized protein n=1 Tax=Timema bartmani TaxID=61472 RepID=A0A7R9I075_9NEOP|nr:unnamed protein product [Timema bartmani]